MKRHLLLFCSMWLLTFNVNAQFTEWPYHLEVSINNTSNPNTLTDYSVLVVVNTATLISQGKMNADGSDIRFTTDYTNDLEYWIDPGIQNERGMNDDSTNIWVKVPSIPGSSTMAMYMLYGYVSAPAKSNIGTTFLLGDDFDDNSLDATKWHTIVNNSGVLSEQNQRLEHNSPATFPESNSYLYSNMQFTEPVVLEMQFKKGGYVYRSTGFHESYETSLNSAYFDWQDYGQISENTTVSGSTTSAVYGNWSTAVEPQYYLKIIRKEDGNFSYFLNIPSTEPGGPMMYNNDIAASIPLSTPLMVFAREHMWQSGSGNTRYEDNIRVRKYSSPEPTAEVIDLFAYYPFNGNLNDESEIGYTVTNYQDIAFDNDRFGNGSSAVIFNGSSSYIDIGQPMGTNPNIITQCAWFYSNNSGIKTSILTQRHADDGSDWPTLALGVDGHAWFGIDDLNYNYYTESTTDLNDGKWHFFCGVKNGTDYILYIDDNYIGTYTDSHVMDGSTQNMHIGFHGAWGNYFNGKIDDVSIYNKALSLSEISQLYANYHGPQAIVAIPDDGQVTLKWSSERISKINQYHIYQDGVLVGNIDVSTVNDTVYTITGLNNYQNYTFYITSTDIYNNVSQPSYTILKAPSATTVTDIDGNVYTTVTIGTQEWMAENLKTTKYNDGTLVPEVTDAATWAGLNASAYCNYNNDINFAHIYGKLYNFYTVIDARNLCPTGWHVPTDAEWTTLTGYLGGTSVAGGKMKEIGTTNWASPNTGADNSSGFTALPGSSRYPDGNFEVTAYLGGWWGSTEATTSTAWERKLYFDDAAIYNLEDDKRSAFSVRCLKDQVGPNPICVSTTGNDGNIGTAAAPLRNIQTALNQALPGDTIKVEAGTYNEGLTTITNVLLFGGYSSSFTEIDRDIFINKTSLSGVGTVIINDLYSSTIEGFEFIGTGSVTDAAIKVYNGSTVKHNIIHGMSASFAPGIEINGGAMVLNNTIYGGSYGIEINSGTGTPIIKNNIITNASWGVVTNAYDATVRTYNNVYLNTYSYTGSDANPGNGDISLDPVFRNIDLFDFRILESSACLDAGDPADMVEGEIYYNTRIDIGVYGGTKHSPYMPPVPGSPTLASPANESTNQPRTITLKWWSLPEVNKYHLQVSTDPTFVSGIIYDNNNVADTAVSISGLLFNTIYYWRVLGSVTLGDGPFSSAYQFTTTTGVIHVSNAGNDSNPGTAILPLKNIQTALNRAVSGDTIKVASGSYSQYLNTLTNIILLGGYNSSFTARDIFNNKTTLNGVSTIILNDANGSTIDGFVFNGGSSVSDAVVKLYNGSVLTHNTFQNLTAMASNNIELYGGAKVINNTVYDGSVAIEINSGTGTPVIKNNIFSYTSFGVVTNGYDATVRTYNCVYGNTYNYTGFDTNPGNGDISIDPLFLDVATNDFRIQSTSPCIDLGDPDPIYNDPDGTTNDMGAFYYDAPPSAPTGLNAVPGNAQITLSWNLNGENDIAYYKVYGGISANPTSVIYQTANNSENIYIVTGLDVGVQYFFRITAIDQFGNESLFSNEVDATTSLDPNLVAYYPFSTNAQDESGNGYNGVETNGVALTSDRFGNANNAFSFDGIDDYIFVAEPIPANFQIQNEITLSAWIYVTALPNGDQQLGMIVGSQNDGTMSGASIMYDGRIDSDGQTCPSGHIHFQVGNGSWHATNANSVVPTNQWVLITATRKANEDAKIYYNNVLQPSTSVAWDGSLTYTNSWFAIGQQKDLNRPFNGLIDEVRVFNKALTESEIDQLYANLNPPQNLTVTPQLGNNIITWDPTGSDKLQKVKIYKDGSLLTELTHPTIEYGNFIDGIVNSNQSYQYYLVSVDNYGNESLPSPAVTITSQTFTPVTVTLKVNMSYQTELGKFNPALDFVDVAGNFNNWNGSSAMTPIGDTIYSITFNNLALGNTYEYKFRRNGSWADYHDFPTGPNRTYIVKAGENTINHWLNDEYPTRKLIQPVADYMFNGNPNDFSEFHNHATVYGNVSPTNERYGYTGGAYSFNGSTDYIQADYGAQLYNNYTTPFSISGWFNISQFVAGESSPIIANWGLSNGTFGWGLVVSPDHRVNFGLDYYGYSRDNIYSTTYVELGQWYHYVATYDGATMKLYINANLESTGTGTGQGTADPQPLLIGKAILEPGDLYGSLDDIKIYNRTLSQAEVDNLFGNFYSLPTISTSTPWSITDTQASVGGQVTADGGLPVTESGVYWGISPNPVSTGTKLAVGSGVNAFGTILTGLNANTTYYVVAYATNNFGTAYGDEVYFTTLSGAVFAGGLGTQADPYQVATADQLNNIRLFLGSTNNDVYFIQIANIDLGISPWADGNGWLPIGDITTQFYGNYNGNGYTISGLYINRPTENYIGLFGWAKEASLTNIGLVNVNILGANRVGALAGQLRDNSYAGNCYSTGTAKGQLFLAGLVGNLYYGSTIENCYSSVNLEMVAGTSNQQTGGLVGRASYNSTIEKSFATGNVTGLGSSTGGLVGLLTDYSSVNNCYATGSVSGDTYVGGLIGGFQESHIRYCYSTGRVSFTGQGGGLVGYNLAAAYTLVESFWNTETSGISTSAIGVGKNTYEMIQSSTYTGWDFGTTWNIYEYSTYPFLQWQGSPTSFNYPPAYIPPSNLTTTPSNGNITLNWQYPSYGGVSYFAIYRDGALLTTTGATSYNDGGLNNYTYYNYYVTAFYSGNESGPSNTVSMFPHTGFAGGDGTETNPYLVSNGGELFTVRLYLDSYFKQVANIDLGASPWNDNEGWKPIGNFGIQFTGSYNGDGFTISNLTINRPNEEPVGLFGSTGSNAYIGNLSFTNVNVTGKNYVGPLAGDVNGSQIFKVTTTGTVSGINYVGGIAGGIFHNSVLSNSISNGTINSSGNWAGGLVGVNYNASIISSSFSSMNIASSGYSIGGLAGTNELKSTISNSYFKGSVSGDYNIGGIVGWNDTSLVKNTYSYGLVTGNSALGGLVGTTNRQAQVNNSYWNTSTSGQSTSAGGEGRTTDDMTYTYATNTYVGWDFTNLWADDPTYTANNGYPLLNMLDIGLPTLQTFGASNITYNSAVVQGNVMTDGGVSVLDRGICWSTLPNPTIENNYLTGGTGIGTFSTTLTGLAQNTTYYAKAYAVNTVGIAYGNEIVFTTIDPALVVFSLIGDTFLSNDGINPCNWSCDKDFTYIGTNGYVSTYTLYNQDLPENVQFKVRKNHDWFESYGYNEITINGDPSNFVKQDVNIQALARRIYTITFTVDWSTSTYTLDFSLLSPSVNTTTISAIEYNSAVGGGDVVNQGTSIVTARGVCWSTNQNPTLSDSYTIDNSGSGPFTSNISGLSQLTTYYVRAYATNSLGVFYGLETNFTTREVFHDATVSSTAYIVDNINNTISNALTSETLENFKANLTPALGATFEVYQADAVTVATDLQTGYYVIVTAEDGITTKYYTITLIDCVEVISQTPSGSTYICQGTSQSDYTTSSAMAVSYVWEITPVSAGSISGSGTTGTVTWNTSFTGTAQIRVRGVNGPCTSTWTDYLDIIVNPLPASVTINGLNSVCKDQNYAEYYVNNISGIDYFWEVTYGSITSGQSTSKIMVNWGSIITNGEVKVTQTNSSTGCVQVDQRSVTIINSTAPPVPDVREKGRINILICTYTNDINYYQWFLNGNAIAGADKQFYVARNNLGNYQVEITNSMGCKNRSYQLNVTGTSSIHTPLSIYPNPGNGNFTFNLECEQIGKVNITIVDSYGLVIRRLITTKSEFVHEEPFNLDDLRGGVYFVKVEVDGIIVDSQKLVIQ